MDTDPIAHQEIEHTPNTIDTPTQGKIKVDAIMQGAQDAGKPQTHVEGHPGIPSNVAEQPTTVIIGFTGALNRIEGLPTNNQTVAIENFAELIQIEGDELRAWLGKMVHDIGAVIRKKKDGTLIFASSVGLRFQEKYYQESKDTDFSETIGRRLEQDPTIEAAQRTLITKDPHNYYTDGTYNRKHCLSLATSLVLIDDQDTQGPLVENAVRQRIKNSGLSLPEDMHITLTSTETLKNAATAKVLALLNASNPTLESHDGSLATNSGQIMSLTQGFQAAYDRIEAIYNNIENPELTRKPGDLTLSIQSCIIPIELGTEVRYLDVATVLIERVDQAGDRHYYSSVSAGTEFPREIVEAALADGVTVGQKMEQLYASNAADVQKQLYGVSRQVIVEEAIFVAIAQMQSGLETI